LGEGVQPVESGVGYTSVGKLAIGKRVAAAASVNFLYAIAVPIAFSGDGVGTSVDAQPAVDKRIMSEAIQMVFFIMDPLTACIAL
jgi:hypothetical protein